MKEVHDKFDEFTSLNSSQKKLTRRQKKYQNFSIKGSDTNSDSLSASNNSSMDSSMDPSTTINVPPRASAIESALNTLICPIPSQEYIMDPASRNPVIFHDKYYHFDKSNDETNVKSRSLRDCLDTLQIGGFINKWL